MSHRIIIFAFIELLSLFIAITPVQAHILATDGNIGAVLHIDPDDDPIAGAQSSFFFDIKDETNKFSAKTCNCRVEIYENGKIIYSDSIVKDKNPSLNTAAFFYTFPTRDVYQVKLIGEPSIPGLFQSFTISYDIRVDRETNTSSQATTDNWFITQTIHFVGFGVILLFFLAYGVYKKVNKKKPVRKEDNNHTSRQDHSNIY